MKVFCEIADAAQSTRQRRVDWRWLERCGAPA